MDKPHLVLVHADAWVRASLSAVLRDAGYSLSMASNGASGLRLIHQLRPDLVLIGPELSEISHDGLLELLRADSRTRRIPVIGLGDRVDHRVSSGCAPGCAGGRLQGRRRASIERMLGWKLVDEGGGGDETPHAWRDTCRGGSELARQCRGWPGGGAAEDQKLSGCFDVAIVPPTPGS